MVVPSLMPTTKSQLVIAQPSAGDQRPNFLLIMGDDFGFSDLGTFGSEISTPNLDALAKDGKILTNYYTHPVCSPARGTFLTGIDNHIVGIGTMFEGITPNQVNKTGYETYITDRVVTIAELLRDAGYNTLLSGKWHLSGKGYHNGTGPADRGFDKSFTLLESGANHFTYEPYYPGNVATFMDNGKIVEKPNGTKYSNEFYTDKMIDYIKDSQNGDRPFFAYLAYQVAHTPFQSPPENMNKYRGVYDAGWDNIREKRIEKQKELGIWPANMTLPKTSPALPDWNALPIEEQKQRAKILEAHAGMIDNMDYNIGRLIQFLKDTGDYDNTFIMFTSDNGGSSPSDTNAALDGVGSVGQSFKKDTSYDAIGGKDSYWGYGWQGAVMSNAPFSGSKTTMYNGGIRPPFVLKEPHSANTPEIDIVKGLVHVSDMVPTFLEYANTTHPSEYNGKPVAALMGKSIKPMLEGVVEQVHPDDEGIASEMFGNRAVLMGDWKTRYNIFPVDDGHWKLFNIKEDITESTDLSKEHPDILSKMVTVYDEYAKDIGIIPPEPSAEQMALMQMKRGNEIANVTSSPALPTQD